MDIGNKIKNLRTEKALTQGELAARCELSKGFISQLERNLTSPSIATLIDILSSLGTNLKEFFNEDEQEQIVFTKNDTFEKEDEELGVNIRWLVPNAQKNDMEPIIITLEEGGSYSEQEAHVGEEFGYVLQGVINVILGKKKFKAKKGESFYFTSKKNHYISNAGKSIAKVIWVSSPPSF